jgi:hypothetical protein
MRKLGLRPRYSFSGNFCFKFSAFCLCSAEAAAGGHMCRKATSTIPGAAPIKVDRCLSNPWCQMLAAISRRCRCRPGSPRFRSHLSYPRDPQPSQLSKVPQPTLTVSGASRNLVVSNAYRQLAFRSHPPPHLSQVHPTSNRRAQMRRCAAAPVVAGTAAAWSPQPSQVPQPP